MPDDELKGLLENLSMERLKIKSARIKNRLRELEHDERGSVTGHYLKTSEFWKQVLYEFVFEALGFSKNKEPMMKLASGLKLKSINKVINNPLLSELFPPLPKGGRGVYHPSDHSKWADGFDKSEQLILIQTLLFSAGGFFFDLRNKDSYIDNIKEIRNNLRPKNKNEKVSKSEWNFFRLRPGNFPTIRLAYGSQLILKILKDVLPK